MPQHLRCLQDAHVTQEQQQSFYTQLVLLLREMYQRCHLVHADLSEYNILVHEVSTFIEAFPVASCGCSHVAHCADV